MREFWIPPIRCNKEGVRCGGGSGGRNVRLFERGFRGKRGGRGMDIGGGTRDIYYIVFFLLFSFIRMFDISGEIIVFLSSFRIRT